MQVLNILTRRTLPLDELDATVAFHETLIGQRARVRFDYPAVQLRLAQVASILFIAGTDESLRPFTATHMTFLVDDIRAFEAHLPTVGATVLEATKDVPTGWNLFARHPDGTLVEYVQHREPHQDDRLPGA